MSTRHAFCPLHRIAYDGDLDPTCPQCVLQRITPPTQLDFDVIRQLPLDASGKHLDRRGQQVVQ